MSGGGEEVAAAPYPSRRGAVLPRQPFTGSTSANHDLSGAPALVRQDNGIDFDWGGVRPAPATPADNFSVRWTNTFRLDKGKYRFITETDDGVRLYINEPPRHRQVANAVTPPTRRDVAQQRRLRHPHGVLRRGGAALPACASEVLKEGNNGPISNIITCVPPQPQNYAG